MEYVVIVMSIITIIFFGWTMWLLPEYKRLSKNLESQRKKYNDLQTNFETSEKEKNDLQTDLNAANTRIEDLESDLVSANTRIEDLESDLVSANTRIEDLESDLVSANTRIEDLESDLDTSEKEKAKALELNANARWQLYLSHISLQAGAVVFYEERAKSELLESTNTVLQEEHDALNRAHQGFVDKSKKKAQNRLILGIAKIGLDWLPYGGTAVDLVAEAADKAKDFFSGPGDAVSDMNDALEDAKSLGETLEDLESGGPIWILISNQDNDEVPAALTEGVQSTYNQVFEQHLMEPEELDPSAFGKFSTEIILQMGNVVTLESVSGDENDEAIRKIFLDFEQLRDEYDDYRETYKSRSADAESSDKKVVDAESSEKKV